MASAPQTETDLWKGNVTALRIALEARKPDAIARLKLQVDKLDGEISALVNRREIILASMASKGGHSSFQGAINEFEYWKSGKGKVDHLTAQIEALAAKMADLESLGQLVKASPLDHDSGPTPEQAGKAREVITGEGECTGEYVNPDPGIDDLNSELKRAAVDIQHGWAVMCKKTTWALGGRTPGDVDVGAKELRLASQYYNWVENMHRRRQSTWAVTDVACEGMSRTESAIRRRCGHQKVYDQLVAGLEVYAKTYAPISSNEEISD